MEAEGSGVQVSIGYMRLKTKKGNNLFLELYKCLVMEFLGCYNSGQIGVNIVFNYKKKTILN